MKIIQRVILIYLLFLFSCHTNTPTVDNKEYYYQLQLALEKTIINDFFSPPVASRIYVYPNLIHSFVLNQEKWINYSAAPTFTKSNIDLKKQEIIANCCFYFIAKKIVFTPTDLELWYHDYKKAFIKDNAVNWVVIEEHAKKYSERFIQWMSKDNYAKLRGAEKYVYGNDIFSWQPTPPDYLDALEPHWKNIRPIFLNQANQFRPQPPSKIDVEYFKKEKNNSYYYDSLDDAKKSIAKYWDCNPLVINHVGHASIPDKKLTPGGHWLKIALSACKKQQLSLAKTSEIMAVTSAAIFDGFISCWETKYFYNYVRPVTLINKLTNSNWVPTLITPNFPEYTSGHSVISGASSTILQHYLGNNYSFIDSSQLQFGIPSKKYASFREAAVEAAISRFYAGIHFKESVEVGLKQGEKIGNYILQQVSKQ